MDACAGDGDLCLLKLRGVSGSCGVGDLALAVSWASWAVAGQGAVCTTWNLRNCELNNEN